MKEEPTLSANQSFMMLKENSSTKKLLKKWEYLFKQSETHSNLGWITETDHRLTNLEEVLPLRLQSKPPNQLNSK